MLDSTTSNFYTLLGFLIRVRVKVRVSGIRVKIFRVKAT